jgi:hypothetical protein
MVMEYGENDDAPDGVTKWPFYFSALFILALVLGFAYLHFQEHNTLDQWQLVTCILASALASVLVFIPHLLDRFLYLVFDPANRKDEELHRKTYFDIKEMRGDLETLAVKVDKVPSLVDKILAESLSGSDKPNPLLEKISTELEESKEELLEKIRIIQELTEQSPLLPEPDPAIAQANESIGKLGSSVNSLASQLENLQDAVSQIPTELPELVAPPIPEPEVPEPQEQDGEAEVEIEPEEEEEEADPIAAIPEEDEPQAETEEVEPEALPEEESVDTEPDVQPQEEETDPEEEEPNDPIEEVSEEPESESEPLAEESAEEEEKAEEKEESDSKPEEPAEEVFEEGEKTEAEPENDELELDLPDPEETLRKVDALLAGEDASAGPETAEEPKKPKPSTGGSTSVIANVMIGIGNKPYLRGEGAGLSWDEGVPMNFIEIGKWAWTPTRKNAALTVQLYRNDEEPDKGGKIEVKSGEEIEITPDFS